jgi:exodeoxyribonuclease-3
MSDGGKDFDAKLRFFGTLAAWASDARSSERSLVICGDQYHTREDRDVRRRSARPIRSARPDERALLNRLIDDGLIDIGRALGQASDNLFTWWPPWRNTRQRNIGWRIDCVLASAPLAGTAASSVSMREFGTSDHALLWSSSVTPGEREKGERVRVRE